VRLLVDEDLASDELMARLRTAGHHVETTEKGVLDAAVWRYAQETELTVLTGNAGDFMAEAQRTPDHHGLLVVYGERDPVKRMRAADIAGAVEHVREVCGEVLRGARLALDEWRHPSDA